MSGVVMRSFCGPGLLNLSDEARQRRKEYLETAGIRMEDVQPIVWPEGAVSACRDNMYDPWQYTTKADIRRRRQLSAKQVLQRKRESRVARKVPLYVWVFWCHGMSFGLFRGWYTYLIGNGTLRYCDKIMRSAQNLFPFVAPTLFNTLEDDDLFDREEERKWQKEFVKRYRRGTWHGKPQGKAPVWGEVEGDQIIRITGRAQWPTKVR